MTTKDSLAEKFVEQVRIEARRRGIDPALVREEDIQVNRNNLNIHIKWKDVEITVPAPSQEAVDSWFTQNGQAIAGSLLTLAGVVVTGAIALAAVSILASKGVDLDL